MPKNKKIEQKRKLIWRSTGKRMMCFRRIKVKRRDEVRGFYSLLTSNFLFHCFPDNEYIVPENALGRLKKEKIEFNEIKNGSKGLRKL